MTRGTRRATSPARPRDAGTGLVELVLAMSLLLVVSGVALQFLLGAVLDDRSLRERSSAVGQARLALSQIDRQVRSGSVLLQPVGCSDENTADPQRCSVRIYTQVDGVRRCVQWQVQGAALRTRSWSPAWRTDGSATGWTTIATGIVNDRPGQRLKRLDPFGPTTGTTPHSARFLTVQLRTQVSGEGGAAVELSSVIAGRNTDYGYDAGVCDDVPAP